VNPNAGQPTARSAASRQQARGAVCRLAQDACLRGLSAYGAGRLDRAAAMAEQAPALARVRGTPRAEAAALVNLGFFRLWTGDFGAALMALNQAEDASPPRKNPAPLRSAGCCRLPS
jgi:hypothetical protein